MAADDYTSLLGRSNQSWGEIAGTLLAEQKGKNKKARKKQKQALVAGLLLSAWDNKKVNNVIQNLQDADVDKQYDIAKATSNWEAYESFVAEDRKYISAGGKKGNYFDTQATIDFNTANPNFDELYKNQRGRHDIRKNEIATRSESLQKQHEEKRNTLKLDVSKPQYLTREKFLKPYEDFYRTKQRRATDPSELSAVHSLFGVVGPARRRRKALDEKLITEENIIKALDKQYAGLLDPVNYGRDVPSYFDPDAIKYTQEDALDFVQRAYGQDPVLTKRLQNSIRKTVATKDVPNTAIKENEISDTDLNALLIASTLDFDNLTEQAVQLKDSFEGVWKTKYNKTELPFTVNKKGVRQYDETDSNLKQAFQWYEEEEDIYVQTELKLYTPESLLLREALLNKEIEEAKPERNMQVIRQYEQVIEKSTMLAGFEAATQEYMRIKSDPSKLAQFNMAWNVKSDLNPTGSLTELEGREEFLTWYMDTINSMRSPKPKD